MTTEQALALEIATLDARIKADGVRLKALKADLIDQVGDEGDTIEVTSATITVTKRTQDRSTGQFSYALDLNGFMAQDERVRANLLKQGIVSQTEKKISGQAPTVKVKAK